MKQHPMFWPNINHTEHAPHQGAGGSWLIFYYIDLVNLGSMQEHCRLYLSVFLAIKQNLNIKYKDGITISSSRFQFTASKASVKCRVA